jgi:hypothetical protein
LDGLKWLVFGAMLHKVPVVKIAPLAILNQAHGTSGCFGN